MLNLQAKDTFFVFDEYGMLTVKSDALSWRDSIGMTVCAWIAYGMLLAGKTISSLLYCYSHNCRHPQYPESELSRDHLSYLLIFRRLFFGGYSNLPVYRRGMYLWSLALQNNKFAEWMYYTLYIPGAILGNWWLKFCRLVGRIGPERSNNLWIATDDDNTYGYYFQKTRTCWQKLWAWIIFQTIPAYPLHNKGWQLYVMPESRKKERLKRILLSRIGISNILLRLLYGDIQVSQLDIANYPQMTGFRPGVYLDESCRRDIRELTPREAEFNCYEKDLIIWLWKNMNQS